MADNTKLPLGTLDGDTYASDDIAGVKIQRVKVVLGADGTNDGDVSSTNALPISDNGDSVTVDGSLTSVASITNVVHVDDNSGNLSIDDGGNNISIDDGGNTITVDNGGTFAVQASIAAAQTLATVTTVGTITNVVHVDDNSGNLSIDDGGNTITVDNGGTFAVQDSEKVADNAGFTDGTSKVQPAGYILDETAGTALTENDAAAARIDSKRSQVITLEDATTRGRRATIDASGRLSVDASGVAVPITDNSGSLTVDQPTGSNLHTVVDSGTITTVSTVSTVTNVVHVDDNSSTLSIDDGGNSITVDNAGTFATQGTTNTVPTATTMQNAATGNANGTSLNVSGYSTAILNITASVAMSGGTTINFEASVDDSTWVAMVGSSVSATTQATTTTTTGDWEFNVAGYKSMRARISAYSAGTITVKGYSIASTGAPNTVSLATGSNTIGAVTGSGTFTTKETRAATAAQSSVANANSDTTLLASNSNRLGATIFNDDTAGTGATLKVKLGTSASATSFTVAMAPQGYYEVPFNYTGAINGISSANTGNARITELSA